MRQRAPLPATALRATRRPWECAYLSPTLLTSPNDVSGRVPSSGTGPTATLMPQCGGVNAAGGSLVTTPLHRSP